MKTKRFWIYVTTAVLVCSGVFFAARTIAIERRQLQQELRERLRGSDGVYIFVDVIAKDKSSQEDIDSLGVTKTHAHFLLVLPSFCGNCSYCQKNTRTDQHRYYDMNPKLFRFHSITSEKKSFPGIYPDYSIKYLS